MIVRAGAQSAEAKRSSAVHSHADRVCAVLARHDGSDARFPVTAHLSMNSGNAACSLTSGSYK
jgi:hypothetical protein